MTPALERWQGLALSGGNEEKLAKPSGFFSASMPPVSLNALPADMLLAILRFLPLVPRMRTVGRLSKRWRELAYRSVDSLTDYPLDKLRYRMPPYHKALRWLTSLVRLDLRVTLSWPQEYVLPITLRHLALRSWCRITVLEPRPALTSLTLRSYADDVPQFIGLFASSLCRLDLFSSSKTLRFTAVVAALHLPQLTYLAVGPELDPHLSAFYRRHASQLEALTIRIPCSRNTFAHRQMHDIVNVHLPRLRVLRVVDDHRINPVASQLLPLVLLQCPRLTALHTNFAPICGASVLRSFKIVSSWCAPQLNVADFPQLEAITFSCFYEHKALTNFCCLITACDMSATPAALLALPTMTRLRSLVISHPAVALPPLANLAALQELTIISSDASCSTLAHFLQYCPGLSKITLSCGALSQGVFNTLLHDLDRRGVAELTYVCQQQRVSRRGRLVVPADLHGLQVHKLAHAPTLRV